jgi:DNA helicase-2/ATP-dependent DNA helicase PcrA
MKFVSDALSLICEFRIVKTFDFIIDFLETDVISNPDYETNALITHFSNHLMDLSTYREADLCSSSSMKEKLFVSTVHKAKGLEFENVIVMRAVTGRYPHFAHKSYSQQEEDKRLFYVAISRAMNRLIVSGYSCKVKKGNDVEEIMFTPFIRTILKHFVVRFELSNYNDNRVIAEIGTNTLKVVTTKQGSKQYDISYIYFNPNIRNQLDLKKLIEQNYKYYEIFSSIESCLAEYSNSY